MEAIAVEKHRVIAPNAAKFIEWMNTRGGIVIWGCLDLGNAGQTWSGPYLTVEGKPATKPHWSETNEPIRHITLMDEVVVDVPKEVKRVRIALQRGSGLSIVLTQAATRRVERAVGQAGPNAWYEFEGDEAVIYVPGAVIPLADWKG